MRVAAAIALPAVFVADAALAAPTVAMGDLSSVVLIADGFGVHVPKGYIYAAMAFSALVEGLNMMQRRRGKAKRAKSGGS